MSRPRRWWPDAALLGTILCVAGIVLLFWPRMLTAALGVEAVATAFWIWSRAAADAQEQLPRWDWLRRPAMAMWVAIAIHAAYGRMHLPPGAEIGLRSAPLAWLQAAAIVWAGLELVAALPLARPFSDLPGPHIATRPWIPVVLPCAGFLVLWSQAPHWQVAPGVRAAATVLLVVTALLGALRAFARRGWTASLRWLTVTNTALALVPLAARTLHPQAVFLLWLAGFGGPAFVLAGELTGASPRRGRMNARLWRLAGWTSMLALSWTALVSLGSVAEGTLRVPAMLASGIAVGISTWIMVGRLEVAPERRRIMRPGAGAMLSRVTATLVLVLGPAGLVLAWWFGFEPGFNASILAIAPAVTGGLAATAPRQTRPLVMGAVVTRFAAVLRVMATRVFPTAVRVEQGLVKAALGIARTLAAPLRDLHTGDAQEYLLFVAGVAVLILLLPLLR